MTCYDPPEDPVISIFPGCLANHDHAHSRPRLVAELEHLKIETRLIDEMFASEMGESFVFLLPLETYCGPSSETTQFLE